MKKVFLVVFIAVILGVTLPFWMKAEKKTQNDSSHNKTFYTTRHKEFFAQLERRDKIKYSAEYTIQKQRTAERYKQLKSNPQVIWGKLLPAEGQTLTPPLKMSINGKSPESRHYPSIVVDDQMRFCFPKVDPGIYEMVLFETSNHPGIRLENIIIKEGQPLAETVIQIGDANAEVTIQDRKGNPVKDAQVLVGKESGGTNSDLYAWRYGLTDASGQFIARNLTDGGYVLAVHTRKQNGSSVISLVSSESTKAVQVLTHNNW
jgi:hypothetical protein